MSDSPNTRDEITSIVGIGRATSPFPAPQGLDNSCLHMLHFYIDIIFLCIEKLGGSKCALKQ